jgi:hypothetical protein
MTTRLARVLRFGVYTLALAACCGAAGARDDEPEDLFKDYYYPNRLKDAYPKRADEAEGSGISGGHAPNLGAIRMETRDEFDQVVRFYMRALELFDPQDRTRTKLEEISPGVITMYGTDRFVNDDSAGRPLQLRTFVHFAKKATVTVVVSRGREEKRTFIDVVLRERVPGK